MNNFRQIYHTYVLDTIEHLSSYLAQLNILQPLTSGWSVGCVLVELLLNWTGWWLSMWSVSLFFFCLVYLITNYIFFLQSLCSLVRVELINLLNWPIWRLDQILKTWSLVNVKNIFLQTLGILFSHISFAYINCLPSLICFHLFFYFFQIFYWLLPCGLMVALFSYSIYPSIFLQTFF